MIAGVMSWKAKLLLAAAVALFALSIVACDDEKAGPPSPIPTASATVPTSTPAPTTAAQTLTESGPFAVGVTTFTLVDAQRPTDANGSYPGAAPRTLATKV